MKNGGAPVYLFQNNTALDNSTTLLAKEALEMAQNGELVGIGFVAVTKHGQISSSFCDGMIANSFAGVAACEYLKKRLMDTLK